MKIFLTSIIGIIIVLAAFMVYKNTNQFDLPKGETEALDDFDSTTQPENNTTTNLGNEKSTVNSKTTREVSNREVFITDGVRHSIPLNEILSGGPPKDGIPSIDEPVFITTENADEWLSNDAPGLGIEISGEARFYPYLILVWHEIVNDEIAGMPILVTYCPLCQTGVVFDRHVSGTVQEFGVSGRLWRSNLLMYNRTGNEETESLWSQVLGEAVLGPATKERLDIIPSDTVRYDAWKKKHPNTKVLSRNTGSVRTYGVDPYGDYYTNRDVSFGATFSDNRLHPKAFVYGIEINGQYKAYDDGALSEGVTSDTFAGKSITIVKDNSGTVRISADGKPLSYISGFWFSWLAVHENTELFK